jgi:1-acyl-sn-glycerol-3-phosphate acyltransferase/long-chain acyl-CoA synthetase
MAARRSQTPLLTVALMRLFNSYIGTPSVTGRENVPPGPFLICANHRSHLDSLALICGLGLPGGCALLGARDYFVEGGLLRRLLALPFTLIAVERQRPGVAMLGTIQAARAFFRDGGRVLIAFPEGSRQSGTAITPFKRGIATLALALGLPVLPVFIDGTERLLAKGRFIPLPGPIKLKLGPPIEPGPRPRGAAWRAGSQRLIMAIEAGVRGLADAGG